MMIYKRRIVEAPIQIMLCFIKHIGWALGRGETRQDTSLKKCIDVLLWNKKQEERKGNTGWAAPKTQSEDVEVGGGVI